MAPGRRSGRIRPPSDGKYKKTIEDKSGKYRAMVGKKTLNGGDDVCVKDTSPTVKHTHH